MFPRRPIRDCQIMSYERSTEQVSRPHNEASQTAGARRTNGMDIGGTKCALIPQTLDSESKSDRTAWKGGSNNVFSSKDPAHEHCSEYYSKQCRERERLHDSLCLFYLCLFVSVLISVCLPVCHVCFCFFLSVSPLKDYYKVGVLTLKKT